MAASQRAVGTGGKSWARFRISTPGGVAFCGAGAFACQPGAPSGMTALLDHLNQVAECRGFRGFGMDEEHRRAARAFARRFVDDLESLFAQIVERLLNAGYAQRHVCEAAAAEI